MKTAQIVFFQVFLVGLPAYGMVKKIEDFAYPPVLYSADQRLREVRTGLEDLAIDEWKQSITIDPTITFCELAQPDRPGVCYDYAMKKLLARYQITQKIITPGCQNWVKALPGYFKQVPTERIKVGDLAVYALFTDTVTAKHFGIVHDPESLIIEGKWGTIKAIFKHNLFSLPLSWGNGVVFFRLKKEYRLPGDLQDRFIGYLKSFLQDPLEMKQVLFYKKLELLELAKSKRKFKIIQLLEQFSCVPLDPRNDMGRTPLMLATLNNNTSLVKLFLSYGSDSNAKDMYLKTPLMLAQEQGYTEIEKILLEHSHDSKK